MSLAALEMQTFLERPIPTRKPLYGEWLKERMAVLVSGQSGAGKSFFVQSLALAISGQISIFGWAPRGDVTVGIFDGENDYEEIKERMAALRSGLGACDERIKIVSRTMVEEQLGRSISLSDQFDQRLIMKAFDDCQLIIVDNVNCCFDITDENATKDWASVQSFVMEVRRAGKAVMLVHHTPKSNPTSPAGSSKNVRPFDYSLLLVRVEGASAMGARFDLQIHKSRRSPKDLLPLRAELVESVGGLRWQLSNLDGPCSSQGPDKTVLLARVRELRGANYSYEQIELETGVKRSTAQRWVVQAER